MLTNGVSKIKAKVIYWAVRTFGPSWKGVKVRDNGSMGPLGPKLVTVRVGVPTVSTEEAKRLIGEVDQALDLEQLDQLSHAIRKNYGSEALQTEIPRLRGFERFMNPDNAPF